MTARTLYTIEEASEVIFDRLGLDRTQPVDIAWRNHLLPALQDGRLTAEGRPAEYVDVGLELDDFGKPWPNALPIRRQPIGPVPRDWWLDAAPKRLSGTILCISRDIDGRTEALEHISIRAVLLDQLWPPPDGGVEQEAPKSKPDNPSGGVRVQAVARALLHLYPNGPTDYRLVMARAVEAHIGYSIAVSTLDRARKIAWPPSPNIVKDRQTTH